MSRSRGPWCPLDPWIDTMRTREGWIISWKDQWEHNPTSLRSAWFHTAKARKMSWFILWVHFLFDRKILLTRPNKGNALWNVWSMWSVACSSSTWLCWTKLFPTCFKEGYKMCYITCPYNLIEMRYLSCLIFSY